MCITVASIYIFGKGVDKPSLPSATCVSKERKHSNLLHAFCDVPGHNLPAPCPAPDTAHAEVLGEVIN